jgi:ubiquinone/menaquinone biosynthesis C-methylase UbiE
MVSAEHTAKKYAGKMAENYEDKREKQERWDIENNIVTKMLTELVKIHQHKIVLDAPVGTGRFLKLYRKLGLHGIGYDSSTAMLGLAKRKRLMPLKLEQVDIKEMPLREKSMDVCVCIRYMDLIPEDAMHQSLKEMARVTRCHIILTIRFGEEYIPKSNTATHDQRKFEALCKRLHLKIIERQPIFQQGWFVLLLEKTDGWQKAGKPQHAKP